MRDKYCVVFLGSPLQKGWISTKSMAPFDAQSLESKVIMKNLNNDKNYLEAVVEGCRVARHEGVIVPSILLAALRDAARATWQDFDEIDWNREDVCTVCRGTEWSGESLLCDECNFSETHLHCLEEPLLHPPLEDWFCSPCAKIVAVRVPVTSMKSIVAESSSNSSSELSGGRVSKRAHEDESRGESSKVARKAKPGSSAVPKFHDAVNLSSASGNKFCGVCKVVGSTEQLVACTFPGCSKAYHPGCVYKRITFPLSDYPLQGAPHSSMLFDPWFCPSHFCASCSALEESQATESLDIGVPYPLFVVANGLHREKKVLHSCTMCPYSLCLECVDTANESVQYSQNDRIFRQVPTKFFNECGEVIEDFVAKDKKNPREAHIEKDSSLCCALCINREYPLQLGRLLEKVLAVMLSNKLSTPFLAPLLPGLEDFYAADALKRDSRGNSAEHLVGVLEKVRSFGYKSYDQFREDLDCIRDRITSILGNLYDHTHVCSVKESVLAIKRGLWVSNHCLVQSFDTVCDEAVHLSSDKLKLLSSLNKRVTVAELSSITLPVHAHRWRAECGMALPSPYSHMYLVPPRSEALWRKHMDLSVSLSGPRPQVAEVVNEFRASEEFQTQTTAEILLNIHGHDWDDSAAVSVERVPGSSSKSKFSDDNANDTKELLEVLQESTRTSLLVQEKLSRKFREHGNAFRIGANDVTIGDLNLLAELKLANDNLRWRLERQTHALDCSAAIVQSLQEQNAKYAQQLEACRCRDSKQSFERSDDASDSG
eukprot:CAMPEP_0114418906 /NCGR_PEP_ID=MMETSP0103-20121206/3746_1 /TAXON_ID=37642 ORGANISM="Paraphysomonas imperforata, Strain PA2" /NCGR_SAMPLE_ID=MMETSP0103 /ASSEMBLY_ACC=CAM_ASM_000201 /LENGTH=769 /DNA_ID=CAMNT_0001587295 /DNA_START=172 /DNA_END=2481 /DNA_ORIENTATION=-